MPRAYFPNVKNQIKVPLGVMDLPENQAIVERTIDRLQTALIEGELHNPDGTFNKVRYQEILGLLGIKPSLKLIKGRGVKTNYPLSQSYQYLKCGISTVNTVESH